MSPERAHRVTIFALKTGLAGATKAPDDPVLAIRRFGLDFSNPVGLAAGFDKNAEVPEAILRQGFGFTEFGTVTPKAQPGNPRPRIFRLPAQRAVINRLGFNNEGLEAAFARIATLRASGRVVERLWAEQLDMINGQRITEIAAAYRAGHKFGNMMLTGIVRKIFGDPIHDMLSGYRVMSRRFVKSFPTIASGFGIETEMTVHALQMRMPIAEMPTQYKDRPAGSASKLRTYHDGVLILNTIVALVRQERPAAFFGGIAAFLAVVALILIYPVVIEYIDTGLVRRFPTAILSTGLMLAAALSLTSGAILDTVTRGRWEVKRLQYLALKGPNVE